MPYLTIKDEGSGFLEEKKSKFISRSKRVESIEEAEEFIKEVKEKNKEARHNPYAFIMGEKKEIIRCSDDGEPSRTSGFPILDVINGYNLTDVCIVVTRYFGGILLGASGLTRAYKKAASLSISEENTIEKVKGTYMEIAFSYDFLGKISYIFKEEKISIKETKYTDLVVISIILEENRIKEIEKKLSNICNGKLTIKKGEIKNYFKFGYDLY